MVKEIGAMLIASHVTMGMMEGKLSDVSDDAKFGDAATKMDVVADAQVNFFRSVCIVLKNFDGRSPMTTCDRFFCSFCWTIRFICDKRPA